MRSRSLIAGTITGLMAAACESASAPVSLAPTFAYTVRWSSGDTLQFSGSSLSWLWAPPAVNASSDSGYIVMIFIGPPLQTTDSLFPRPIFILQGTGPQFRTSCPPNGRLGVGAIASPAWSVGVQLWLGAEEAAAAESGQVVLHPLADTVVAGQLDLTYLQPAPGFRVTGTFTAHSPGELCQ